MKDSECATNPQLFPGEEMPLALFAQAWHVLDDKELAIRVERVLATAPPRATGPRAFTRSRSERYAAIMKHAQILAEWGAETEEASNKASTVLQSALSDLLRESAAAPAQAQEQRVAAARAAADPTNPVVMNPQLSSKRGRKQQTRQVGKDPSAPGGKSKGKAKKRQRT